MRACFGWESRNKPVFFLPIPHRQISPSPLKGEPTCRQAGVGVRVEISIFSPSPLSPPTKGGEDFGEIGGTFGKI